MGHNKPVLLLSLLLLLCVTALGQRAVDSSEWFVIAGKGWGKICLGAQQQTVEDVIGKGENRSKYDDVYFIDYPDHGIQISYNNSDQTVHTIYFYNRQRRYERFAIFNGKIEKGVSWDSSPSQVINAYGKPREDYQGEGWRRLVFAGIDFRFENNVMVRIGIPGN